MVGYRLAMSEVPPPPPGYSVAPTPPPPPPANYGTPAGGTWGAAPPPGGYVTPKGPRPKVPVGGWLMVAGSALALIGVFLPWVSALGESINGMDDFIGREFDLTESPGSVTIIGALIGLGLGITLVAAGRVLAVAILGVVASAIGVILGIGLVAIASDMADFVGGDLGIGAIVQPIGPIVALAGAIVALAKRRPALPPGGYGTLGSYPTAGPLR